MVQWKFNYNSNIFSQENASEHISYKMAVILSQPQCAKEVYIEDITTNQFIP